MILLLKGGMTMTGLKNYIFTGTIASKCKEEILGHLLKLLLPW
jgi:hypothetical protein